MSLSDSQVDLDALLDAALDEFEAEQGPSQSTPLTASSALIDPMTGVVDVLLATVRSSDSVDAGKDVETAQMVLGLETLRREMKEGMEGKEERKTETTTVEQTIEKMMREVAENAKTAKPDMGAAGLDGLDVAKMDEMFKQMFGDLNEEKTGNMDSMMDDMMKQMQGLFSKDMMKQPMLDICQKYPAWLEKSVGKLSAAEFQQHEKQYSCFKRICAALEQPGDDMKEVMALMQEMQGYGSPPKEILDELMPNIGEIPNFGAGGLPPPPPELADMDPEKLKDMCRTQ